jgi:hypothetical protein
MTRAHTTFALTLGLCSLACTDPDDLGPNISGIGGEGIVKVAIIPATTTVLIGDTVRVTDRVRLQGVAYGRMNGPIDVDRFVWRSSDSTVATVDSTGVVTPIRAGEVEITASAYRVGRARVLVLQIPTSTP